MTTEEKARAYDEALKTAKRIISKNCSKVEKLCLKCVFPELAESEDERIRKRLIEYFEGFRMGNAEVKWEGLTVQEVLAWLEKRKEHHLELYYDKELDNAAREFYLSGGANSPFDSTGLVPIVRMAEFGATWMKERMEKEQKPAEWSEEDEDAIRGAIGILLDDNNPNFVFPEHSKLSVGEIVKRLKSLPERFNLVPKPEWSEEDEKMLRTIISDGIRGVELDSKQISWLKSLRPVSKESLQSWKPSEEQMESLAYAIQVLNSNPHPKSAKAYQDLQTLYKNIKYGN